MRKVLTLVAVAMLAIVGVGYTSPPDDTVPEETTTTVVEETTTTTVAETTTTTTPETTTTQPTPTTTAPTCADVGDNIPTTDRNLDADGDGIGCETPAVAPPAVPQVTQPEFTG